MRLWRWAMKEPPGVCAPCTKPSGRCLWSCPRTSPCGNAVPISPLVPSLSEPLSVGKPHNGRARCGQGACFRRARAVPTVRNSQTYVPTLKKTLLVSGFLEIKPYLRDTISEAIFMKKSLFILSLLACFLTACSSRPGKTADADERPLITVTIEPLRYFTEALAGDRFRVVSMVPKGASPETYDPTPNQLVDLSESFQDAEKLWNIAIKTLKFKMSVG